MNTIDLVIKFKEQFDNVYRDESKLASIMTEVFLDIQLRTDIFKLIFKLDFIPPGADKPTIYSFDLKTLLDFTASYKDEYKIITPDDKAITLGQELPTPEAEVNLVERKAIGNKVLGVYTKDFGKLRNATIKNDILLLDKDSFDFTYNDYCLVYGSILVYDLDNIDEYSFITIKNALYWGVLDKLHVSVSNANNAQMENLYFQRYYQAVNDIIKLDPFILGIHDSSNNNIDNFV